MIRAPRKPVNVRGAYRILTVCPEGLGRSGLLGLEMVRALGGNVDHINNFGLTPHLGVLLDGIPELGGKSVRIMGRGVFAWSPEVRLSPEDLDRAHLVVVPGKNFLAEEESIRVLKRKAGFDEAAYRKALGKHARNDTIVVEPELLSPRFVTSRKKIIAMLKKSKKSKWSVQTSRRQQRRR